MKQNFILDNTELIRIGKVAKGYSFTPPSQIEESFRRRMLYAREFIKAPTAEQKSIIYAAIELEEDAIRKFFIFT